MADIPPPLQGPTAKEKKYDRQLRLWGATGQIALENSHILLINSGPGVVGLETLKNLVLPGAGTFTIQDSAVVDEADLGVNFFLEEKHLGGFRAEHTCVLLKELNPDVQGHSISEPVESWLTQPDALKPYSLIIVTAPIQPDLLAKLAAHADQALVPLFYIHSVGFYSHFSIHLPPAFPIVDTHPSPETTTDLRLLKPWPELIAYAEEKTKGIESMAADDHGHIPYVAILLHYLQVWKKEHNGEVPNNYKDKTAFRHLVTAATRTDTPEGGEENFEEAVSAVLKSLNAPEPSSTVKEIFKVPECVIIRDNSPPFWVIAHAIGLFYTKYGVLPVPGAVPDMKARSADYIQLQNVYKSKARKDLAEVLESVRFLERNANMSTHIEEKDVEAFCKNAAHIKLVRGRPFHVVPAEGDLKFGANAKSLAPGSSDADFDSDTEKMTSTALKLVDSLVKEASYTIDEDEYDTIRAQIAELAQELVRAGGGELHNIAALTGGMVSQEVIKVITEQYVPVDNTCVFDGVRSKSSVFRV
ncbi:ThiF family protein [Paraphaeosphaeria minitans]|uniref:NEDD8-activating enzyme E1 regulatory subunit n=1 Tax=Paraphaeosphaeria minitans TaxID=565426 RepID=A0A9P6GQH6_9PLEO|nr:ThiF family protein [Paraphaeosphaeria minitans]